jgi:hypothetical protein
MLMSEPLVQVTLAGLSLLLDEVSSYLSHLDSRVAQFSISADVKQRSIEEPHLQTVELNTNIAEGQK